MDKHIIILVSHQKTHIQTWLRMFLLCRKKGRRILNIMRASLSLRKVASSWLKMLTHQIVDRVMPFHSSQVSLRINKTLSSLFDNHQMISWAWNTGKVYSHTNQQAQNKKHHNLTNRFPNMSSISTIWKR